MLRGLSRALAGRLRAPTRWHPGHASPCGAPLRVAAPAPPLRRAAHWSLTPRAASDAPAVGEGYEEVEIELPSHCPGCGVRLQDENPDAPGFFQVSKRLIKALSDPDPEEGLEFVEDDDEEEEEAAVAEATPLPADEEPPFQAFDDMVEGWLEDNGGDDDDLFGDGGGTKRRRPAGPQPRSFADAAAEEDPLSQILCARCYSLSHYGRVKSETAEAALPGFDFGRVVGSRLALQKFRRSVVLMVVDLGDFDGSLPRAAIRSLVPPGTAGADGTPSTFRLVVAANKADLLPRQATQKRIEAWVRRRMAQGGLPRPSSVHVVSSARGSGVKPLLADLQAAVGTRGDVWVVGAQNAGKSSLINAMRGAVGLPAERKVTVAPVAGTTLGVVAVPSLLPQGCKMLDTPGVPHEYQLAAVMSAEEMRALLPRRPLRPRTYRAAPGQTVSLGGVARVDVEECPGATMYLTVWASDDVACHLGKTAAAGELWARHAGTRLTPPVGGEDRMAAFPALEPTEVEVTGDSWRESSADVAVAGLGWVAAGVDGAARLRVWAPPGVAITTREAMVPDYARDLERPGFGQTLPGGGTKEKRRGGGGGKKGGRKPR